MLEAWALHQSRCYNPITKHTLIRAVNYLLRHENPRRELFKVHSNHRTWVKGFMQRNTVVGLRTPDNLKTAR